MIRLGDIMNLSDLSVAISDGFVRSQVHPTLSLTILNYTEKAQWERAWNDVTRQCRGLIVDADKFVVARPFPKFFNYGEHPEGSLDLNAPGIVTDKMDGSLGIMYPSPLHRSGFAIATRGSFTSDQALFATQLLNDRYADWACAQSTTRTPLFEIIYPENRIVLDYGNMRDLVWLDTICIRDGQSFFQGDWPGEMAAAMQAATLREALALPPRKNAEGVVVSMHDGLRVKIKQEDYVALHRLITGMNARVVWERLGAGDTISGICEGLPEEFWPWVNEVGNELIHAAWWLVNETYDVFDRIVACLPEDYTRKDFALAAQQSGHRARLFMLLDGRTADVHKQVWGTLKPSGTRALVAIGEDVA